MLQQPFAGTLSAVASGGPCHLISHQALAAYVTTFSIVTSLHSRLPKGSPGHSQDKKLKRDWTQGQAGAAPHFAASACLPCAVDLLPTGSGRPGNDQPQLPPQPRQTCQQPPRDAPTRHAAVQAARPPAPHPLGAAAWLQAQPWALLQARLLEQSHLTPLPPQQQAVRATQLWPQLMGFRFAGACRCAR